jgi:carbonic anhydrase
MPDQFAQRLRRFHDDAFPRYQARFRDLVDGGQHPSTLFIGCCDSRLLPHLLTGAGPGELFVVRNVGALVPPFEGTPQGGHHGTAAAIEFAVLSLGVRHVVVCGHSHCGAMQALYEGVPSEARNLAAWLDLAREAALPVMPTPEALRRTEQRAVVLQLDRLMGYPMVRCRVESGELALHGWHYVIEAGEVHVLDVASGRFVPASQAENSGSEPLAKGDRFEQPIFNEIDATVGDPLGRL